jgi:hypothetical protein
MGESVTTEQLVQKLSASATKIPALNRRGVQAAAFAAKKVVLAAAKADTGGKGMMSHGGARLSDGTRRGIKLGAGYEVVGTADATAVLRARPQGPWSWLEFGVVRHKETVRKRGGKQALGLANGQAFASVVHPGVRAKKTWTRGSREAKVPADVAYRRVVAGHLLDSFK